VDELAIGRLGGPHGVEGRIRLVVFSGEADHLLSLTEAKLKGADKAMTLRIEDIQSHGDGALIKFAGYDSPETVRVLSGLEMWASRDKATPLYEDQYYYADLVGCVLAVGEKPVGTIVGVGEGGGGDLLELSRPDGTTAYVPFRKEFIGKVDVAGKRVELIAPWILV
jgi:16S rRNA processing protein RimM